MNIFFISMPAMKHGRVNSPSVGWLNISICTLPSVQVMRGCRCGLPQLSIVTASCHNEQKVMLFWQVTSAAYIVVYWHLPSRSRTLSLQWKHSDMSTVTELLQMVSDNLHYLRCRCVEFCRHSEFRLPLEHAVVVPGIVTRGSHQGVAFAQEMLQPLRAKLWSWELWLDSPPLWSAIDSVFKCWNFIRALPDDCIGH